MKLALTTMWYKAVLGKTWAGFESSAIRTTDKKKKKKKKKKKNEIKDVHKNNEESQISF